MDIDEYLRNPASAAVIAAIITSGYIYGKSRLNNEGTLPMSAYAKPSSLVAILVYFIVDNGIGKREIISTDAFN